MATEIEQALAAIQSEFNELKELMGSNISGDLARELDDVGISLRNATRDASLAGNSFSALQAKIMQSGNAMSMFGTEFRTVGDTLINSADGLASKFGNVATEVIGIGLAAAGLVRTPQGFDSLGRSAQDASYQVGTVTSQIEALAGLGGTKFKSAMGAFGNALKLGGSSRNFENAMLQAVAAGGNMGDMIGIVGNDLAGLDNQMSRWVVQTQKVADVTGMSTDQVLKFSHELSRLPEAIGSGVRVGESATRTYGELESIIRTAHGTFQDIDDVFKDVKFSIDILGSSVQESLEMTSRMAAVGQSLKLPMDIMRMFVQNAAQAFKFLGDNTQGAISIMADMGPALRESGLGPAAVQEVVAGFTKGVADMDIAQKAFLSAQTGGAGGLQGAFEVDLALREGNLDDVASKVQSSLEGIIGGPLVTLEEAAKSQSAAAQMTKQIQFLTTGPFKVAQTEQQAIALVEAMARQQRGEMGGAGAPSPAEALENAMQRGEAREDRQIDILQVMSNEASAQTILLGQLIDQRRREFLGPTGGVAGPILRQEKERQSADIRMTASEGGTLQSVPQTDTRGQMSAGGMRMVDMAREAARSMGTMLRDIPEVPSVDELREQRMSREQMGAIDEGTRLAMRRESLSRPEMVVRESLPQPTIKTGAGQEESGSGIAPENLRTVTIKVTNDDDKIIKLIDAQINMHTGQIVKQSVREANKSLNDGMHGAGVN